MITATFANTYKKHSILTEPQIALLDGHLTFQNPQLRPISTSRRSRTYSRRIPYRCHSFRRVSASVRAMQVRSSSRTQVNGCDYSTVMALLSKVSTGYHLLQGLGPFSPFNEAQSLTYLAQVLFVW